MSSLVAQGRRTPPHTSVVTDFVAHSQWIARHIDCYCVAADEVKHEFIARGIPAQRIVVTGMPVRAEFAEPVDPAAVRAALGLGDRAPVVLAMAGSRVRLVVSLANMLAADLGVDLGGGNVRMAQQLLNHAKVHAAAEHMGREAVAERVRRHRALDAGVARIALDDQPETLPRQALTPAIDEESGLFALADQACPGSVNVVA